MINVTNEKKLVVSYDRVNKIYAFKNDFRRYNKIEVNGEQHSFENMDLNQSIITMVNEPLTVSELVSENQLVKYKHAKAETFASVKEYDEMKRKLLEKGNYDDEDDPIFDDEEDEIRYKLFQRSWIKQFAYVEKKVNYTIQIVLKPISEYPEITTFASLDAKEITSTVCKLDINGFVMSHLRNELIRELDPENIKMWTELNSFRFAKRGNVYWQCPEKYKQLSKVSMIGSYYECVSKRLQFIDEIRVGIKETLLRADDNVIGEVTHGMLFERMREIKQLVGDIDVKVGSMERQKRANCKIREVINILMNATTQGQK